MSIRRTSIERNENGRIVLTDCENAEIEADSFEEFIEKTATDKVRTRDILGDSICNALGNVIKPSDIGKLLHNVLKMTFSFQSTWCALL